MKGSLIPLLLCVSLMAGEDTPRTQAPHDEASQRPNATPPPIRHPTKGPEITEPQPPELANHSMIFVIGAHHSGTTILDLIIGENKDATTIKDSGAPEDEGQHLQKVYSPASKLGGMLQYALHPNAYMDEYDETMTVASRDSIFMSWKRFWDLSKKYLVEKSPRHTMMTRYLQALFTSEKTHFPIILRHPLGCSHFLWGQRSKASVIADCGERFIHHWLLIHRTLEADLPFLRHATVMQMEDLLRNSDSTQGLTDRLFQFLGMEASVHIVTVSGRPEVQVQEQNATATTLTPMMSSTMTPETPPSPRRLLGYTGSRTEIRVFTGTEFSWVDDWRSIHGNMSSAQCVSVIEKYERQLNHFGYSLANLTAFHNPPAFRSHLLKNDKY